MEDDIVKTLRDWADSAYEQGVENMITGLWDAANEIEKLRAEVDRLKRSIGCARDQRSTQFCAEALDAQREAKELRKERDEARRMVCAAYALRGRDIATERGWDCLKDGWDCDAEDQIPEAL